MMNNSFISVIGVLQADYQLRFLPDYLHGVYELLHSNFSDFEIILVNNHLGEKPDSRLEELAPEIRPNIFLLNLASKTPYNHAILAGLDRANGDYTVIFEPELYQRPELILQLFEKTRAHFDIVYLRSASRRYPWHLGLFYRVFYSIMRRFSHLQIDHRAFDTRIISRRALNSFLRMRENLRYMKAIYSMVGYHTTSIELKDAPLPPERISFSERFRTSMIAISSYTTFLRSLLLWIFIGSFLFLILVVINALLVKFTGTDLFGNPEEAVKGWTFLVILISIFFAGNFLILYIMSVYLSNIYQEIKQRPLYIIESIKRF